MIRALSCLCLLLLCPGCPGGWQIGVPDGSAGDDDTTGGGGDDDLADDDGAPLEHVPGAEVPGLPPLCHVELECARTVVDDPKVPCELLVTEADGTVLYDGWAGVEIRGRSSSGFPKPHYSVELWEGGRELIPAGENWRYRDSGGPSPPDWTSTTYDDSGWSSGWAPLGYGGYEATTISYGGDPSHRHITTWFRRRFDVTDASLAGPLTIQLRRDDGAVVYLNGSEVMRSNMPGGAVAADTVAHADITGTYETKYVSTTFDPDALVTGSNVVAVELHQRSASSDDLLFDLWLGDVGEEVSFDFFGMGGDADWILNGNYADRALFRNQLSYDLFRSWGGPENYATETVLCELTRDGEWLGVFTLGERVKRDDDRVDIAEDPDDLGRSFIVKSDDGGGCIAAASSTYGEWCLVYPRPEHVSDLALTGIRSHLQSFENAALSADPGNPHDGLFTWVDLDSAVDWVLIQELSKNNDAYFLSIYLWKDVDGPMVLLPWDHDLAWGGYPVNNCGSADWVAYRAPLIAAMASVPEFRERLAERWWELRGGPLAEEALLARIDSYREVIGDAAYDNFEVWPMDDIEFSWDGTNWLCPVSSYDAEMSRFETWISGRVDWMDAHIADY